MELTTTTKCDVRVFATLNPDASLTLKIVAHAEYADGMATSAEIPGAELPPEQVADLRTRLLALIDGQDKKLSVLLQQAIHESRRVGRARQELDASFAPIRTVETKEVANA